MTGGLSNRGMRTGLAFSGGTETLAAGAPGADGPLGVGDGEAATSLWSSSMTLFG